MKIIFIFFLVALFLSCMHQANELNGASPKRLIVGLILIMISDVTIGLCVLYGLTNAIDTVVGSCMLAGVTLWLYSERRTKRDARRSK